MRNRPAQPVTPDEEVAGGIAKFDLPALGAQYAYTVDGGALGEINTETWNARSAKVIFKGRLWLPCFANSRPLVT